MKLGDFIDLDRQLHLDPHAGDARQRLARDRRIGRESGVADTSSSGDEAALLLAWKNGVASDQAEHSLGTVMAGAVRWTALLLVVIGLVAGASAAAALLRYDGTQPINVLFFLGAIVGLQLLLLPVLLLSFIFRSRLWHGFRLVRGLVGGLLTQMLQLLVRFGVSPEEAAKLRGDIGLLRARSSLFARVQPLVAVALIQVFGAAFNLAVAGTLLFFVIFSDLTFSWATTVQVEPERIHRITSVLSAPWSGLIPQARPSLELVEATRFVRMDGSFAPADPEAALRAGGWWPFLLAATVTYGLIPRLLALGSSLLLLRVEMRRALARSSQVQDLKERLRTPLVTVDSDSGAEPAEARETETDAAGAAEVKDGLSLAVVFWAYDEAPPEDAVSEILRKSIGAEVKSRFSAGGIEAREDVVLNSLIREKEEGTIEGAAVFFEPFEPPKTDARRFLHRARENLGPSAPMVVFLAEFSGAGVEPVKRDDWNAWNHAIRSTGDPYLFLAEREVVP